MTLPLHRLATDTFVPMLESLSGVLDKGAAHAQAKGLDLVNARLAPDMFPLAKQVNIACFFAMNAMARLSGQPALTQGEPRGSFAELKAQIAEALAVVRGTPLRLGPARSRWARGGVRLSPQAGVRRPDRTRRA